MESTRLLHLLTMKTFAVTLIIAVALIARSFAAPQTHNYMDKHKEPTSDSIAFPLLIAEDEKSKTYITHISKDDCPAGSELLYLELRDEGNSWRRIESIEVAGENDIFLGYEEETRRNEIITGPDSDGVFTSDGESGSRTRHWLRFVPQEDGSYEVSTICVLCEWWDGFVISHGEPIGRWEHYGNSTKPHNTVAMQILELYNTYITTGKVRQQ